MVVEQEIAVQVRAGVDGAAPLAATFSVASALLMIVVGMLGIFLIPPDTPDVSPVKTHLPSSWFGVTDGLGSEASLTPANAHCVFHQENLR